MKVTFLGTGTSQGIPVITCKCKVCSSSDPMDKRLRTSAMVEVDGQTLVIDTGPDFRQQMLREDVMHLDAVIYTHEHKDHVAGMDDIRAFNFKDGGKEMEIFATEQVQRALINEFHYVFADNKYPGVPKVHLNKIENKHFHIGPTEIIPIEVKHFQMPVFGYRIYDFTYITDAKTIGSGEIEKIYGTKVLVLNVLRKSQHISHFNLEEALALVREIQPERAYFTHISHLLGKHEEISRELPQNVFLAYDGLKIEI